jgi:putative protease
MAALHEAEPDLELECFVHGALCYSFSGLCLASGLVLGRSGNRGECAQLCRSYYDAERPSGPSGGRRGYWFSCRDLELGGRVGELARAGIVSFKVEGRMKSPEYCYAVAHLYRGYIDALAGHGPGEEEMAVRLDAARLAFSRSPTEAWLFEQGGSHLIDSAYPGHRGVTAGRVEKSLGRRIFVELSRPVGLRDGLLGFEHRITPSEGSSDLPQPSRFPLLGLRDARTGRELTHAREATHVEFELPLSDGDKPPIFKQGDELRLISSRASDRKAVSPEEYEGEREKLELSLSIGDEGIAAELSLPRFDGMKSAGSVGIEASGSLPLDLAKSPGGFERALGLFSESGDYDFILAPSIDWNEEIGLPDGRKARTSELFIPPSVLKREKNRIYAEAADRIADAQMAYARESMKSCDEVSRRSAARHYTANAAVSAPPRAALAFPREGLAKGMPFATKRDLVDSRELPSWGGRSWLPLAPLVADRAEYAKLAEDRASSELAAGKSLSIGLGALHHFGIGRRMLARNPDAAERLSFFLDINLYVANGLAWENLSSLLPRVEFAYRYLELEGAKDDTEALPFASAGKDFEPPLFQSLGCLLKHHINKGSCPEDCGRFWSITLSDRNRRYRVLAEDCVSYLFRV